VFVVVAADQLVLELLVIILFWLLTSGQISKHAAHRSQNIGLDLFGFLENVSLFLQLE
jgi:hypothetical protein